MVHRSPKGTIWPALSGPPAPHEFLTLRCIPLSASFNGHSPRRFSLTASPEASRLSYLAWLAHPDQTSLPEKSAEGLLPGPPPALGVPPTSLKGEPCTLQIFFDERTWNVL